MTVIRKPAPPPTGTAALILRIRVNRKTQEVETEYHVSFIHDTHPGVASPPAIRLSKIDADGEPEVYDLHLDPRWGWHCSCADATFRGRICKHEKAARGKGILRLVEMAAGHREPLPVRRERMAGEEG